MIINKKGKEKFNGNIEKEVDMNYCPTVYVWMKEERWCPSDILVWNLSRFFGTMCFKILNEGEKSIKCREKCLWQHSLSVKQSFVFWQVINNAYSVCWRLQDFVIEMYLCLLSKDICTFKNIYHNEANKFNVLIGSRWISITLQL